MLVVIHKSLKEKLKIKRPEINTSVIRGCITSSRKVLHISLNNFSNMEFLYDNGILQFRYLNDCYIDIRDPKFDLNVILDAVVDCIICDHEMTKLFRLSEQKLISATSEMRKKEQIPF